MARAAFLLAAFRMSRWEFRGLGRGCCASRARGATGAARKVELDVHCAPLGSRSRAWGSLLPAGPGSSPRFESPSPPLRLSPAALLGPPPSRWEAGIGRPPRLTGSSALSSCSKYFGVTARIPQVKGLGILRERGWLEFPECL